MRRVIRMTCAATLALFCAAGPARAQDSHNPGGIPAPSRTEINLGPVEFLRYNQQVVSQGEPEQDKRKALLVHCPGQSESALTRTCYQQVFRKLVNQGVTGVRFQFDIADGLDPAGNVNQEWLGALRDFLQDLYCGGDPQNPPPCNSRTTAAIPNITPTLGWEHWEPEWTGPPAVTFPQNCLDPLYTVRDQAGHIRFRFSKTGPFSQVWMQTPNDTPKWDYPTWNDNGKTKYDCTPAMPDPSDPATEVFFGWTKMFQFIDAVLQAARYPFGLSNMRGLNVFELDGNNEIYLWGIPVRARLIVDNTHSEYGLQSVDVMEHLRQMMQTYFGDPDRVTYSTMEWRANTWEGDHPADCVSNYGDSARVHQFSQTIAAIRGGFFGQDPVFYDLNHGSLPCASSFPQSDLIQLPSSHPGPKIADIHSSPCLEGVVGKDLNNNDATDCRQDSNGLDKAPAEAKAVFDAIHNFLETYGPSGPPEHWRCNQGECQPNLFSATVMLGETFGHTLPGCPLDVLPTPPIYWSTLFSRYVVGGLLDSQLRQRKDGTEPSGWWYSGPGSISYPGRGSGRASMAPTPSRPATRSISTLRSRQASRVLFHRR